MRFKRLYKTPRLLSLEKKNSVQNKIATMPRKIPISSTPLYSKAARLAAANPYAAGGIAVGAAAIPVGIFTFLNYLKKQKQPATTAAALQAAAIAAGVLPPQVQARAFVPPPPPPPPARAPAVTRLSPTQDELIELREAARAVPLPDIDEDYELRKEESDAIKEKEGLDSDVVIVNGDRFYALQKKYYKTTGDFLIQFISDNPEYEQLSGGNITWLASYKDDLIPFLEKLGKRKTTLENFAEAPMIIIIDQGDDNIPVVEDAAQQKFIKMFSNVYDSLRPLRDLNAQLQLAQLQEGEDMGQPKPTLIDLIGQAQVPPAAPPTAPEIPDVPAAPPMGGDDIPFAPPVDVPSAPPMDAPPVDVLDAPPAAALAPPRKSPKPPVAAKPITNVFEELKRKADEAAAKRAAKAAEEAAKAARKAAKEAEKAAKAAKKTRSKQTIVASPQRVKDVFGKLDFEKGPVFIESELAKPENQDLINALVVEFKENIEKAEEKLESKIGRLEGKMTQLTFGTRAASDANKLQNNWKTNQPIPKKTPAQQKTAEYLELQGEKRMYEFILNKLVPPEIDDDESPSPIEEKPKAMPKQTGIMGALGAAMAGRRANVGKDDETPTSPNDDWDDSPA
jgi:hypothetical protein